MPNNEMVFPAMLILGEEGLWERPSWARTDDDDEWRTLGYKAWTYEGKVFFQHDQLAVVQRWLTDHGYEDTGDGKHYLRKES